MAKEESPPWLKRMDNGAIGEARSKAFLMDRFWILERSVDIDGADFVIQRKIRAVNLLDPKPPRFGIVQVKFFSDPSTTQYIHKEYLLDKNGNPREEFFVMCHTGTESEAVCYVLSARDILQSFEEVREGLSNAGKYSIPGRVLLGVDHFKVISPKLVLDRMERAIEQADFRNNRAFLSWALPSVDCDLGKIDPLFLEPLENWWGDIPSAFVEMKKKARYALGEIEQLHAEYTEIVETPDPERALFLAEEIKGSLGSMGRVSLSLPNDLFDCDFFTVVKEHKRKYERLKASGKLDSFLSLRHHILETIAKDLGPKMPLRGDDVCILDITYSINALHDCQIQIGFVKENDLSLPTESRGHEEMTKSSAILASEPGSIKAYFIPARYGHWRKEPVSWTEHFLAESPYILLDIMEDVYAHLW